MNIPENIYVQEGLSFDQVSGLFKLVENDKQAYILYSPLNDKKYKYTYKTELFYYNLVFKEFSLV